MSPYDAVAALAEAHALPLRLVGPLAGGEVGGAQEVRWGASGRGVLKVFADDPQAAGTSLELLGRLHARGYPAPPVLLAQELPHALAVVLGWSAGTTRERVDHALVDDVLSAGELQAGAATGVGAGEAWGSLVLRALRQGRSPAEGVSQQLPLRRHSPRTSRLLDRIIGVGNAIEADAFEERDAMHGDFHHRNLLIADGRLEAVVDWDSARPGDRAFDLVTLAFCSAVAERQPGAVERLLSVARSIRSSAVVDAYLAHIALRQVDWSIRRRTPADVDTWVEAAEAALS